MSGPLCALPLALLWAASPAHGGAAPQPEAVRAAMERATRFMISIATEGGYLWRYSPDLAERAGESFASPTQIWIQPPGTPAMGMAFLNARTATGDAVHLEAARGAAGALARCQLPSGGWHYSGDFDPARPNRDGLRSFQGDRAAQGNPDADKNPHYRLATTFDDNTTQSAIRFLMAFVEAAHGADDPRDEPIRLALDRALDGMLRAQYPNGAWPQRYDGRPRDPAAFPVRPAVMPQDFPRTWPAVDYTACYTLNDGCQRDCIRVMFDAHKRYGKREHLEAARRGADFLLLARLPEPQPGWAQQYGADMAPAWARAFEPPAVSSCETRSALDALLDARDATGDGKYLGPIPAALDWLRRSQVAPDTWVRFYELRTNRPLYGRADGTFTYDAQGARSGYGWRSDFGIPQFIARHERITRAAGPEQAPQPPDPEHIAAISRKTARVLGQLDARGRWLSRERFRKNAADQEVISTRVFIENINALARFLESQTAAR